MDVRRIALEVLIRTQKGGYSSISLDSAIKKNSLDQRDSSFLTALVMGVIEKQTVLDYYISKLSNIPLAKLENEVAVILRLGLYQLIYTDKIPPHAAVDSSVSLCTKRTSGYVNAILRNYLRKKDELVLPDGGTVGYLSVAYSFPTAICERFITDYGYEKTEKILKAFCTKPGLTLRVNTLRITRDDLLCKLQTAGYVARKCRYAETGIRLPDGANVTSLPGYDEGWFFIQDEASQICTAALSAMDGMTCADICSAPGSKSFAAAINMNNNGRIYAFDIHENKLDLIRNGAERLGIGIITADMADGRIRKDELVGSCDRVICDVPCSGYGVMAKKPEIRYKNPKDSEGLPQIQYDILENASAYLRTGGRLVYSTCTLLKDENYNNIDKFLTKHSDFSLLPVKAGELDIPDGYITLTPDEYGTDGFFIAVLTKRG